MQASEITLLTSRAQFSFQHFDQPNKLDEFCSQLTGKQLGLFWLKDSYSEVSVDGSEIKYPNLKIMSAMIEIKGKAWYRLLVELDGKAARCHAFYAQPPTNAILIQNLQSDKTFCPSDARVLRVKY